ncbi:hypothetical protein ACJX0J_039543 [Zea mays]
MQLAPLVLECLGVLTLTFLIFSISLLLEIFLEFSKMIKNYLRDHFSIEQGGKIEWFLDYISIDFLPMILAPILLSEERGRDALALGEVTNMLEFDVSMSGLKNYTMLIIVTLVVLNYKGFGMEGVVR